ncbi:transglutaminase-like domain-containing protein [Streptomyces sp. NPDC055210]
MPSARLAPDTAAFYAAQSAFSDPNDLAPLYADLPNDPAQLACIARNLMIHRSEGEPFGCAIPQDRLHNDAETRYLDDILRIIIERDAAPLTQRRDVRDRFVGVCRDFALLYCSFLRHAGTPARLRTGFADYFDSNGFHSDHVVTEYADPKAFGLHPPQEGPMCGEWFVAHDIRIDLAALNKVETLLWDTWGTEPDSDEKMTDTIRALCDQVSLVTSDYVPFDAARTLFTQNDGLRTSRTVLSLTPFNGPREVTLRSGPGSSTSTSHRPPRPARRTTRR